MEPIVDGLEQEYQKEITFFSINAGTDGKETFRYYNLPGHPGYVLLNTSGDVLWSGFGELTVEKINGELKDHVFQTE